MDLSPVFEVEFYPELANAAFDEIIEFCDSIVDLHPHVRVLWVYYTIQLATFFPLLVERWSSANSNLTKLILHGGSEREEMNRLWWKAIRMMNGLREIVWKDMPQLPEELRTQSAVFLHVTTVTIENYRWDMIPVFLLFGALLTDFHFTSDVDRIKDYDLDHLEGVIASNPTIGYNLEQVSVKCQRKYYNDGIVSINGFMKLLRVLCRPRFSKLRFVYIFGLHDVPFEDVLTQLWRLPALNELVIESPLIQLTPPVVDRFGPLKLVTTLFIGETLPEEYTYEQFETTVAKLFPNLTRLRISSLSDDFVRQLSRQMQTLFPQMRSPMIVKIKFPDLTDIHQQEDNRKMDIKVEEEESSSIREIKSEKITLFPSKTDSQQQQQHQQNDTTPMEIKQEENGYNHIQRIKEESFTPPRTPTGMEQ